MCTPATTTAARSLKPNRGIVTLHFQEYSGSAVSNVPGLPHSRLSTGVVVSMKQSPPALKIEERPFDEMMPAYLQPSLHKVLRGQKTKDQKKVTT